MKKIMLAVATLVLVPVIGHAETHTYSDIETEKYVEEYIQYYEEADKPVFSDIAYSEFRDYIETLADEEIVGGYPNGTFRPDANITTAEALKIIYESAESIPVKDVKVDYTPDLSTYVAQAKREFPELSFEGTDPAERGDILYMAVYISKYFAEKEYINDLSEEEIRADNYTFEYNVFDDYNHDDIRFNTMVGANNEGIVSGYPDNTFRPDQPITRGEFSKVIYKIFFDARSELAQCHAEGGFIDIAERNGGGETGFVDTYCFHYTKNGGETCYDGRDCGNPDFPDSVGLCIAKNSTDMVGTCAEISPVYDCVQILEYVDTWSLYKDETVWNREECNDYGG